MFDGTFEQSTILRTGPDGLTRVIVRSSWAERESILVESLRSRGGRASAVGEVSPRGVGVRTDLGALCVLRGKRTTGEAMKFDARVGGHAPCHLREAFQSWIDGGMGSENVTVGDSEEIRSIEWLLGQLWNCTDVLPIEYCSSLELLQGCTYAAAARSIKASR
jgi:hypothetical protein